MPREILLSLYSPAAPSAPALRTTGMWPCGRRECEQVFFIAPFSLRGIPLSLRWTTKGNCAIGTVEKGTTFLRFKIKPKTRKCFIKTPKKVRQSRYQNGPDWPTQWEKVLFSQHFVWPPQPQHRQPAAAPAAGEGPEWFPAAPVSSVHHWLLLRLHFT